MKNAHLPDFDGGTYDRQLDHDRLGTQLERVYDVLVRHRDRGHITLRNLARAAGAPEASVSARIRDLRKSKFGGYNVDARRRDEGGTWEYRLLPEKPPEDDWPDDSDFTQPSLFVDQEDS